MPSFIAEINMNISNLKLLVKGCYLRPYYYQSQCCSFYIWFRNAEHIFYHAHNLKIVVVKLFIVLFVQYNTLAIESLLSCVQMQIQYVKLTKQDSDDNVIQYLLWGRLYTLVLALTCRSCRNCTPVHPGISWLRSMSFLCTSWPWILRSRRDSVQSSINA